MKNLRLRRPCPKRNVDIRATRSTCSFGALRPYRRTRQPLGHMIGVRTTWHGTTSRRVLVPRVDPAYEFQSGNLVSPLQAELVLPGTDAFSRELVFPEPPLSPSHLSLIPLPHSHLSHSYRLALPRVIWLVALICNRGAQRMRVGAALLL